MANLEDRLRRLIFSAQKKIKTDTRIQIAIYAVVIIILILIGSVIISTTIYREKDFMKYNLKSCFNKNSIEGNSSQSTMYAWHSDNLVLSYDFMQKCYKKMDFNYEIEEGTINLYLSPVNMDDSCICETSFTAEMGPLTLPEYTVRIYKKISGEKYIVEEKKIKLGEIP